MTTEAMSLIPYSRERLALLFALTVVLVVAFLSYRGWTAFNRHADQEQTTQAILSETSALLTSLSDAETGQRGFLLTGDERYLDPYRKARKDLPVLMNSLRTVAISRPDQAIRIKNLSSLVDLKLEELALTIDLHHNKGADAALVVVRSGIGQALMDRIWIIISEVQAAAHERLSSDDRHARASGNEGGLVSILGCASLFLLLLFANVIIQRGTARRQALITELQGEQQALQTSETSFRQLADSIPQMVWTAAADGNRDYYNRRWQDYTGMNLEQTRNTGWESVLHPDDWQTYLDQWRQSTANGEPYDIEYRFKRAQDGVYRWQLGRALPVRDAQGAVVRWFGTCTDIDDYKQAQLEIRTLNERLEERVHARTADLARTNEQLAKANEELHAFSLRLAQSNRELQEFASVASHDLQEPLRKVEAFGDRLKTLAREAMDEQGRDYLDRMLNATKRMRSLIEDLLKFARVTSQAQPFLPVDLAQVTREVLSDLELRIAETHALVEVGELPTIDADALQMRQLLQNLIGNALKFHHPGKRPVIHLYREKADLGLPPDGMARLVVEDKGIGFDEKYLDRIFAVFQRLHGRGEFEGTGIGLAICRKIVQRHGGDITAKSTPGQGASFLVSLPVHHPAGNSPGTLSEIPADADMDFGVLNAALRTDLQNSTIQPYGFSEPRAPASGFAELPTPLPANSSAQEKLL